MQPQDMIGTAGSKMEGGANCAMAARQHGVDGRVQLRDPLCDARRPASFPTRMASWFSDLFANMQADLDKDNRATGEAHLLDVAGGHAAGDGECRRQTP